MYPWVFFFIFSPSDDHRSINFEFFACSYVWVFFRKFYNFQLFFNGVAISWFFCGCSSTISFSSSKFSSSLGISLLQSPLDLTSSQYYVQLYFTSRYGRSQQEQFLHKDLRFNVQLYLTSRYGRSLGWTLNRAATVYCTK